MSRYRERIQKWTLVTAAALSGGTTFVSCDTRFRQDFVNGTKNWVYSLLDPTLYLDALLIGSQNDLTDGQ